MAKNLKLSVKNTQLAEALKLGQLRKPAAPKKKKEEEIPKEPLASPPVPPPEKVEVAPPPAPASAPPPVEKVAEPEPLKPAAAAPPASATPREKEAATPPAPASAAPDTQPGTQTGAPTAAPVRPALRGPLPYGPVVRPAPPRKLELKRPTPPNSFQPKRPATAPNFQPAAGASAGAPKTEKGSPSEEKPARKTAFKDYKDLKPQKKTDGKRGFDSRDRQGLRASEDEIWRKRRPSNKMREVEEEVVIRPKALSIRLPITVKDLSASMKLKASQLISKLFMQGVVITLNDFLDDETTVQLLGHEFECEITIDKSEEERIRITDKTIKQEIQETPPASLVLRPPVVTFMGHVDHGKTSLIDKIRQTNLAAEEAGAITQHIGAFKCHTAVGDLTILDTPGHEAFSAMRSRGADVTDIIVLVIAGDEGIKAQTVEAIEQAKKAAVPILVAINKADKPNFNPDNVFRQLADQELLPEVWGGTTITVNCSAVSGVGIKELLEMLALQAEVLELKANPHHRARGTVIESEMHKGMGPVATLLIQNGTLRLGDALVFDQHWARVKNMQNEYGKELREAGPSSPVKITGLSGLPDAGSEFISVKNEKEARDVSYERSLGKKTALQVQPKRTTLESLMQDKGERVVKKVLNLILRADVQGSLDALKNSLMKIASNKVDLNILSADVGEISESDIQLAATAKSPIIGFHTQIESHAETLIKQTKVTIKMHDIIYHAVDDVKELMLALLDKIPQENETGVALVKATFKASQLGVIAGCTVESGTIKRSNHVRVVREGQVVWKGPIASLKRVKEDVREVSKGYECGILLQNFNEVKEGDLLQAFEITYLQQEL